MRDFCHLAAAVFGRVEFMTEDGHMGIADKDTLEFAEHILPKKACQLRIEHAEPTVWKVKEGVTGFEGQETKAVKLTLTITDTAVQTPTEGARIRSTIEHQFNVERHPYFSKKTGEVAMLGRASLYDLEEAFGFAPKFFDAEGNAIAPVITRSGRSVAPKVSGVQRSPNPDFLAAYFHSDGTVNPENWAGKTVYGDVEIEENEVYGSKNIIRRFRQAPQVI